MKIITKAALTILLSFAFIASSTGFSQNPDESHESDIRKFMVSTGFVPAFKYGIDLEVKRIGRSTPELDAILAMPNEKIVAALIPVFKSQLPPEEAKIVANFYSTESGKRISEQQMASLDNPNPTIKLTPDQKREYEIFAASKGGKALEQFGLFQQSDAFWQLVEEALKQASRN